ncbi:MAG: CdaR family protein, partial [Oscillospiraceae bacterium]|nr:CdaR family protein [Oscillospiraceae bacterium]
MKKTRLTKLFENKKFSLVLSIIVAVLAWLVVSMSDESNTTKTIYGVPVDFTYNASTYRNAGLDIINQTEVKVDLEIRGPAKDIGRLTAKDFVVYPNVNSVVSAGTKELDLVYQTARKNVSYQVIDCSQTTVSVQFDEVVTQKFMVEPVLEEVKVKEGYIQSSAYTAPAEISITGPKTALSKIAKVQAHLQQDLGELSESRIAPADIALYNREGIELDMTPFTIDTKTVDVTISVLKRAELKLT